jgi:hypothetical protein
MGALRDRTSLLIDVLERSIGMLTIAHTMASNAGLAGKFLAFDQHLDGGVGLDVVEDSGGAGRQSRHSEKE